jgi:hypothetical protein
MVNMVSVETSNKVKTENEMWVPLTHVEEKITDLRVSRTPPRAIGRAPIREAKPYRPSSSKIYEQGTQFSSPYYNNPRLSRWFNPSQLH